MKATRKTLALLLAVLMVFTMLPQAAMAAGDGVPGGGYTGSGTQDGVTWYQITYNQPGTVDFVLLPYGAAQPSAEQVKNHQDASGAGATYYGSVVTTHPESIPTQNDAVLLRTDDALYTSLVPNKYSLFAVCTDDDGTSNVTNWRHFTYTDGSGTHTYPYAFEIKEHLTVTVKDSITSFGIENATVKIGSEQKSTDSSGVATFDLSGGSYDCLIQATGYVGQSTTHNALVQSLSWNVSLVEGAGGDYLATLHVEDDAGVKLKNAQITVDSQTKTADANGEAEFILTPGSYSYTVSALGRTTGTGTFAVEDANMTKNITLYNSSAGVDVTINGHVEGQLRNELGDYLSDNCLDPSRVRSLTVNGADLNGDDFDTGYWAGYGTCGIGGLNSWYNNIITAIDLSGASLDGNRLPGDAFYNFTKLASITLPGSMTAIGDAAFKNCDALTSYTIPNGVTTLGARVFADCGGLTSVTLPDSVTTIGGYLFGSPFEDLSIAPVTDVNVSFSNPSSVTVNGNAFYNNSSAVLHVSEGNAGAYKGDTRDGSTTDGKWFGLYIYDPDAAAPVIKGLAAGWWWDGTSVFFNFSSDSPGRYYYAMVDDGAAEPVINTSGTGTAVTESGSGLQGFNIFGGPATAKDIYIVLKGSNGKLSNILKMDIPALDAALVDITVTGHVKGNIAEEINAELTKVNLSYNYDRVGGLTVTGGTISGDDAEFIYDTAYYLTNVDFSGTSFEYNTIPEEFFEWSDTLKTIILPGNVEAIDDWAFYELEALESVTLGSAAPPAVGEGVFEEVADGAVVYVPTGSKDAYLAVDDGNTTDGKWYGLTVMEIGTAPASATITTDSLPDGTVGIAYSQTLAATGSAPITWSMADGSDPLPGGLTLSGEGVISGTPTTAGTFNFTVKATNAAGSDTQAFSITITAASVAPSITTDNLSDGTVGIAYSQTLAATGSAPITWNLDSGDLPGGLTLSSSGVISGTPTTAGTFNFTVKATNAAGSDTQALSIVISAGPTYSLTITAGTGGSATDSGNYAPGAVVTITATPNSGYKFSQWTIVSGAGAFGNANNASTTFTMAEGAATIRATFTPVDDGGDDDPDYIPRTLTDSATGITIFGSLIHRDAALTIKDMALEAAGTCDACDAIRERMADDDFMLLFGKDIALSGGFNGSLTITVPVGSAYNGQTVTILHCSNGTLETFAATVKDGKATFTVTSLSPIAVFSVSDELDDIPKTGDSSSPWVWWLLCGVSAMGVASLVVLSKRKKAYKR